MPRRITAFFLSLCLALPAVAEVGDDGLHDAPFLRETFKDLSEDFEEAAAEGRTLMVIVEQRGCIYCKKMYEEVFVQPDIAAMLEDEYFVVQVNMDGATEMTDFDGTALSEGDMVDAWGFRFTPTMMFFPAGDAPGVPAPEASLMTVPGAMTEEDTRSLLLWASDAETAASMPLSDFHASRTGG